MLKEKNNLVRIIRLRRYDYAKNCFFFVFVNDAGRKLIRRQW